MKKRFPLGGGTRVRGVVGRRVGSAAEAMPLEPASTTITYDGETITLSEAAQWAYTVDGYPIIITPPGGLTITSRTTAESTRAGRVVHGAMKNPMRGLAHGWDGQQLDNSGTPVEGYYSAGSKASFPISVVPGDIVVLAVSETVATPTVVNGPIVSYHPYYFVSSAPAVNSFAPAAIGWSGRSAKTFRALDLDPIVAALPAYAVTGFDMPVYADILENMSRFEIAWGKFILPAPGGYEAMTTRGWMNSAGAYGRYPAAVIGAAGMFLVSDALSSAQKKVLLTRFISHGIQDFDPAEGEAPWVVGGNGGHWQFQFLLDIIYLHYMSRSAALDDLPTIHPGCQLMQPFIFDAGKIADLAPHSSLDKPHPYRLRTLAGGSVSGNVVTVPWSQTGEQGDPYRIGMQGLRLKRQSDGASALILSTSGTHEEVLTIDAQPTPAFAPGDVVYAEASHTISVGDADWNISGDTYWNHYSPSWSADYRSLNFFSDDLMVARALGIWRSDWDAMQAYTIRANRTNDPSASQDFPTHHDVVWDNKNFARDFWNAHAASLIPGAPINLMRPSISGAIVVGSTLTATPGTWGGTATISYAYQWNRDGSSISGATASTYTLVDGVDNGTLITATVTAINSSGSASETSVAVGPVESAYSPVAVEFGSGEKMVQSSGFTATGSKYALAFPSVYYVTTWPASGEMFGLRNSGGNTRFYCNFASSGRIAITALNSAGTTIGQFTSNTSEFAADTWYTLAIALNTEAGKGWQVYKRTNGGSWAAVGAGTNTFTTDGVIGDCGRYYVNDVGVNAYWADYYCTIGQTLDLSVSGNRDKLLPLQSKGANGSLVTGTQPPLFFSGAVGSWHLNKGSGGGNALTGTLSAAPSAPT